MAESAPGWGELLAQFTLDLPWLVAIGLAGGWYVAAFARARGTGRARHPWWKLGVFLLGLLAVAAAVLSPVEHYGNQLLWVNFLGFLLLTMCAAPLLVLGSPLTLAFRVAGPAGSGRLRAFYRSRAMRALTFPIVSWLLFAVVTYAWQFSGLTDHAADNAAIRDIQLATLFAVSLCFWLPALCTDPLRWRMAYPLRALYVFVEMTHKGLFGGMFLSATNTFHPGFAANLPAWASITPLDDQRLAILVLWVGGNAIFLVALGGILIRWMQYERRNSHRTDWRLDLARKAERRRRAALDQVFRRGI